MATDDHPPTTDDRRDGGTDRSNDDRLSDTERDALHEVELGLEWLQRAQGNLIEFHHATGHGMDHLNRAESMLRESGHTTHADELRETVLPHGVVDGDRWSYDVLESFQDTVHTEICRFERQVRDDLAGGDRHLRERRQERRWKARANDR